MKSAIGSGRPLFLAIVFTAVLEFLSPEALPAADYQVSGAGSAAVNGVYVESGTYNGRPRYVLSGTDFELRFNNWYYDRWEIWDTDWWETYYYTDDAGDTPPSTGWGVECCTALAPAPTVQSSTLVELASFVAEATEEGVLVKWETASEVETAGFNVWRSAAADGEYSKVNESLIPAEGGATQGASYSFLDASALEPGSTWFYKLEEVENSGASAMHGPVEVTVPAEDAESWGAPDSAEASSIADQDREISEGFNVFSMLLPPAAAITLWRRRRRKEEIQRGE
ncbi:MAG: hypothetical protein AB1640_15825 [bacterium]